MQARITEEHDRLVSELELRHAEELAALRREVAALRAHSHDHEEGAAVEAHGASSSACGNRTIAAELAPSPPHLLLPMGVHSVSQPEDKAQDKETAPAGQPPERDPTEDLGEDFERSRQVSGESSVSGAGSLVNKEVKAERRRMVKQILMNAQQLDENPEHVQSLSIRQRVSTREDIVEKVVNPVMCAIILVNTVLIGVSTNMHTSWRGWLFFDTFFISCYLIEVALKLYLLGCRHYFKGHGWAWNWFDVFIIMVSTVDLVSSYATYEDNDAGSSSLIIFRLVRLTRFGRMLRLFQFEVFRELLIMLNGLLSAMRTLLWAFILLLIPVYALALLLTSTVGRDEGATPEVKQAFEDLGVSMFNVFRCSIGDCSLINGTPAILVLTRDYGWIFAGVYIVAIMLITFGIFNLIMATFVNQALAAARKSEIQRQRQRLNDVQRQTGKISELVSRLWHFQNDRLPEGERQEHFEPDQALQTNITKQVFEDTLQVTEVQDVLEDLDIPDDDRAGLFDVLDADGGGTLQMDELIDGIIKLRGDPRRSDVVHIGLVVRNVQAQLSVALAENKKAIHRCLHHIESLTTGLGMAPGKRSSSTLVWPIGHKTGQVQVC